MTAKRPGTSWVRFVALAVAIVVLTVVVITLPVGDWLKALLDWTEQLGVWGPVIVAAFYIVACIVLLPGSVLTIGAGLAFGVVVGTVTVSIGSTLGAAAAFAVGRFAARDWIAAKVAANAKFAAVDAAVGRQGFKIVLLTRLSPAFPFNIQNYAYGLTAVGFWKYLLASWIGMLPGTVMYVYIGSVAGFAARSRSVGEYILYGVGLAATVVVTVLVTRIARKALRAATAGVESSADQEADHAPQGPAGCSAEGGSFRSC